jgi:putative ABC transport system ATP-binding protein
MATWWTSLRPGHAEPRPMLELEHVHKSYRSADEEIHAVDDVSMSVDATELVAIFGPSGSGKSTLLSVVAGLMKPDSGFVRFEGADVGALDSKKTLAYRRTKLGIVFQSFKLQAGLTAEENVAIPLLLRDVDRDEARSRARQALAEVGLSPRAKHFPDRLSGGEQQRVAIARALVGEPRLILADEPTGNLDSATGNDVLALMSSMTHEHGAAAIVVTHDPIVAGFADRVVGMHDGRLAKYDAATPPIAT